MLLLHLFQNYGLWSELCYLEYRGCKQPFRESQLQPLTTGPSCVPFGALLTISCGPHWQGNPGGLATYDLF